MQDYDDFPAEVEDEEDNEMLEDETIENFEDRVLNKRAAQLHRSVLCILSGRGGFVLRRARMRMGTRIRIRMSVRMRIRRRREGFLDGRGLDLG